jgi:hypothetical protein
MARRFVLLVALLVLSAQVQAQVGKIINSIFGGHSSSGKRNPDPPKSENQNDSASEQERQLGNLKTALKLTPMQELSWQSYEESVRSLMADLTHASQSPAAPDQTAAQRINQRVDTARIRLIEMEQISDATQRLYDDLSDEQKAIADKLLPATIPSLTEPGPPANAGGQNVRSRKNE